MFGAILLDMDGTLVDSEEITIAAIEEILGQRGIVFTREHKDFTARHAWDKVLDLLYTAHPDLPPVRTFLDQVLSRKAVMMKSGQVPLLPGAREIFTRLSATMKLAVVSGSFSHEIAFLLSHMGVEDHCHFSLGGDQMTRHKPHPESYLTAARVLGVAPEQCLVVEDSPFGIEAGLKSGAAVVAISAGNRYGFDQSAAHFILPTLNDLTLPTLADLYRQWQAMRPAPGRTP